MSAKALYAAFEVYPRPKGSSSHIRSMLEALASEFGRVAVACLGPADLPAFEDDGRIAIHRMVHGSSDLLARATAFSHHVALQAARNAATLELIVFRDPWSGVPALRQLPRCASIFEVNALPGWELRYSRPRYSDSPSLQAKIGDIERFCLKRASDVLCVSRVTAAALQRENVPPDRITVIPNTAAPECFDPPVACPSLAWLNHRKWIGYIGGLQPWQGVELLIDAFAAAADDMPDTNLVIIHSGNRDARHLSRRIQQKGLQSRVVLQDPLPPADLAAVMPRLYGTAAPLTETFRNTHQGCCPVKIVESMAAGVPVIASALEVSRELIRHDHDGLLVPAGDRRAWAHALRRLTCDLPLRDRLGRAARATAFEKFSRATAHHQLKQLFRSTAGVTA